VCAEPVIARVFKAATRSVETTAPQSIADSAEASCYYHQGNRAVVACQVCGRFLCALCDLDLDGRHLCPACLQRGAKVERAPTLEDRRVLYDSIALQLATWPILTFWLPVFTAPAALYIAIRHWRSPTSILPRNRVRYWLAIVFALAEIGLVLFFIGTLIWFVPQVRVPTQQ
jgi:hypothetical protein